MRIVKVSLVIGEQRLDHLSMFEGGGRGLRFGFESHLLRIMGNRSDEGPFSLLFPPIFLGSNPLF